MNPQLTPAQIHGLKSLRSELAAIPETGWCKNRVSDGNGRRCAFGNIYKLDGTEPRPLSEKERGPRCMLLMAVMQDLPAGNPLVNANDGYSANYPQETPRLRSLAFLTDLIEGTTD